MMARLEAAEDQFRCGFVSLIGRPNVGKSTLMNSLICQKISIVSRKPQTTQRRLLGIKTTPTCQMIFIDVPGFQRSPHLALHRHMNKEVSCAIREADLILFMVEAIHWNKTDQDILERLLCHQKKIVILANKVDKLARRERLLPFIQNISARAQHLTEIIPISARKHQNLDRLEKCIKRYLPRSGPVYSEDQISDRSERFFAAEFIREKLMKRLSKELPYSLSVTIEGFKQINKIVYINAIIWVEKPSQKAIVIGSGGGLLKTIGQQARQEIEKILNGKVHLKTWVKVRKKWADSESALREFGYLDSIVK